MIAAGKDEVFKQHLTGWRKSFEDAMVVIEGYRTHSDHGMRRIACWLTETSANPYDYLGRSFAHNFSSADSFAGLLQMIQHALLDDGMIAFVVVNGRPVIAFEDKFEIENVELRSSIELLVAERRGVERQYEVLDGVDAFIERRDHYDRAQLKSIRLRQAVADGEMTEEEMRAILRSL
jgi:hypothetical protein